MFMILQNNRKYFERAFTKVLRMKVDIRYFFGDYVIKNENAPDVSLLVPEQFVDDPNYIQRLIQSIYIDAESKGISESKIIADYTGGTKSMTAGMVIACASPNRYLEYIIQSDSRAIMEVDISYNMRPVRG